ncbi:HrcA family transcriptional regulator [Campylobacter sp. faydin G-24]|uniref:HrcA family transcriptional regulator n=1 Tax=Campylobacter anatolicus TaxID=2829105 RepID=A0ABS5HI99_9BACT|nr:HrcA family transcriptional regulator [Campylobacter anatolicus]MBR8462024.1 HrcA family transcriptional regulator [Campylobacter anatolicus]MBR8463858.1 HrcA family transcriptional regulator [Campylobacter anatolicus]
MQKLNKRDLVLNSIIQAYLSDNTPIGSSELGSRMNVAMPASTIRVYFKKLSDEGEITQLHISGGRIPTINAMRRYWSDIFYGKDISVDINNPLNLKLLCDKFELYCMIFGDFDQNLEEILNLNDRFLVLSFEQDEIVLKYDTRVEKFLQNLLGVSLNKLEVVCSQVGLSELRSKIRELKRAKIYFQENEVLAFQMFDDERYKMIFEPSFAALMNDGLTFAPVFKDEFMGLKLDINFQGDSAVMICAGSVYIDYVKFINKIKEAA